MSTTKVTVYDHDGNPHELTRAGAHIQVAAGKATFERVAPIESAAHAGKVETAAEKPKPKPKKVPAKKK